MLDIELSYLINEHNIIHANANPKRSGIYLLLINQIIGLKKIIEEIKKPNDEFNFVEKILFV